MANSTVPAHSSSLPPLEELFERARQLEAAALAQIHDRFYPGVYRYIRFRLEDEATVAELVEETFQQFFEALLQHKVSHANAQSWFLENCSHLVLGYLKRHPQRKQQTIISSEDSTPETSKQQLALENDIRLAMRKLPHEAGHVLAVRFAEGRSIEETALLLGRDVDVIKAMQWRALLSLHQLLVKD